MARGSKKGGDNVGAPSSEANPDAAERSRLKKMALTSKNMLSETAAKVLSPLSPSKTVLKHRGKDILKKSQRKIRYLFSFPGLLAPITGGKIGDLANLGTKNPILYLNFPQGQMKLFGTIVYPKNRYLTLKFSRGGKNVMCEDYFDNMIVFSEAWWIGRKEENPDETRLEFPRELIEGQNVEYDFKGGAGAAPGIELASNKSVTKHVEQESSNVDLEDDFSDDELSLNNMEATPVRHSLRTAGKKFNFADGSSTDGSVDDEDDIPEGEENKAIVNVDIGRNQFPVKMQESTRSVTKSSKLSDSSAAKSVELSCKKQGALVQANLSAMFKKAEEKGEKSMKNTKVDEITSVGTETTKKGKQPEVEDDDIEDFSSPSQDQDDVESDQNSDQDWAA